MQRLHVHSPSPSDESAVRPELPPAAVLHGRTHSTPCILYREGLSSQKLFYGGHLNVLSISSPSSARKAAKKGLKGRICLHARQGLHSVQLSMC